MTDRTAAVTWGQLAEVAPELAAFGAGRLAARPSYLATVRADGAPRVHPVTPIVSEASLFVFMEPTSPKGADLREREVFALHSGVPDDNGTGGEFVVTGRGVFTDDPTDRAAAIAAATYGPADRYILFELRIESVRAKAYGDVSTPAPDRWPT